MFFCSEFGLSRKGYPAGYEAQICPAGSGEEQLTGSLYGFAPIKESLVEPNRWFTMEVTRDGQIIVIKINGKTAVRFKDEKNTYTKGHFALQQTAGTTIAFRRIDVLDPGPGQYRLRPTADTLPLVAFWNENRKDAATASTPGMRRTLEKTGYIFPQVIGRVLKDAAAGTAPLLLYESKDRRELLTVSTEVGKKAALDTGYKLLGEQGHVYREPRPGTVPLNLYWNPDRKDFFTCSSEYPRGRPETQGYRFVRTEGHVIPAWRNQPRPWAILLCKFNDKSDYEPHPASFYRQAFTEAGAGKGREFDYFREVSGGSLDLTGSKIFGWMTMPRHSTKDFKGPDGKGDGQRPVLHGWAVEAAKAKGIDLTPFFGVMVFFNQQTDSGAFGSVGEPNLVVMGYNGADWAPPFHCHELGHGFGMGHSKLPRPLSEYGDRWDIMGSGDFRVKRGSFEIGSGFNAFHLRQTGCISTERIWTANPGPGSQTITLAGHNQFDADGFLMAVIPPARGSTSDSSYIVEFHRKKAWGENIPHDAVLVYEDRNNGYPYLLSRKNTWDDMDAMQTLPGQTFEVPLRELTVKAESFDLDASTARVTITVGKPGELSRHVKRVTEYAIVNVQSGRFLDAEAGVWLGDGGKVRLRTAAKNANQKWNIVKEGKQTVTIMNVADGRLMDADSAGIDREGTQIALYGIDTKDRPNRLWKIVPLGKGEVAIVNAKSGRCLDADTDTIDKEDTVVALWGTDAKDKPNRRWKLVPVARWPNTAPNLVVNGSFEDGPFFRADDVWLELKEGSTAIKGWKVTGSLLVTGSLWEHAEGSNSLLLHSPDRRGGIEQTFATKKGQRYRVSFALAANPNKGRWKPEETATAIRVSAAGKSQAYAFDCKEKLPDNMGWTVEEWEFVATGDTTTLAFTTEETDRGFWHGPALDDVWVEAVGPQGR